MYLDDNFFNDDNTRLFASSLRSNKNLTRLDLRGNGITDTGIKTLYKSIFDYQDLNTINDSNCTCELELFSESAPIPNGIDEVVLRMSGK